MHVDYVVENYKKMKFPKFADPFTDLQILKALCTDEFVDFCAIHGDDKIKSIAETMKISFGYRIVSIKQRKKITEKQKFSLAFFLIEKFGNAKDCILNVYKINDSYFEQV